MEPGLKPPTTSTAPHPLSQTGVYVFAIGHAAALSVMALGLVTATTGVERDAAFVLGGAVICVVYGWACLLRYRARLEPGNRSRAILTTLLFLEPWPMLMFLGRDGTESLLIEYGMLWNVPLILACWFAAYFAARKATARPEQHTRWTWPIFVLLLLFALPSAFVFVGLNIAQTAPSPLIKLLPDEYRNYLFDHAMSRAARVAPMGRGWLSPPRLIQLAVESDGPEMENAYGIVIARNNITEREKLGMARRILERETPSSDNTALLEMQGRAARFIAVTGTAEELRPYLKVGALNSSACRLLVEGMYMFHRPYLPELQPDLVRLAAETNDSKLKHEAQRAYWYSFSYQEFKSRLRDLLREAPENLMEQLEQAAGNTDFERYEALRLICIAEGTPKVQCWAIRYSKLHGRDVMYTELTAMEKHWADPDSSVRRAVTAALAAQMEFKLEHFPKCDVSEQGLFPETAEELAEREEMKKLLAIKRVERAKGVYIYYLWPVPGK